MCDSFIRKLMHRRNYEKNLHYKFFYDDCRKILTLVQREFKAEGSLAEIRPPVAVVGDIHGHV